MSERFSWLSSRFEGTHLLHVCIPTPQHVPPESWAQFAKVWKEHSMKRRSHWEDRLCVWRFRNLLNGEHVGVILCDLPTVKLLMEEEAEVWIAARRLGLGAM